MSIFLFLKPLIDMFYSLQWLDVAMVLLVLGMLVYQFLLTRPNVKQMLTWADGIIGLLFVLLTLAFLRDTVAYQAYLKVLSGFLLYFVGRLYYDRLLECDEALAFTSYLVVYLNFTHRLVTFGTDMLKVHNAHGDFYYYDTDMAYGIILAFIFIGMYARNSIFKILTMFVICPYMVFWSDAGIQMILFIVIVCVMLLYILEVAIHRRKMASMGLAILLTGLLVLVAVIYLPIITGDSSRTWAVFGSGSVLDMTNMESMYREWRQVLGGIPSWNTVLFWVGNSLNTGLPLKSLYLKVFYSMGILGLVLAVVFIVRTFYAATKVEDRKTFYVTIMLAILMLGTGVTVNSMESTQMSWFVMMFAGMVISSEQVEKME